MANEIHFHETSFEIIFELCVHFIRVCFFSKTSVKKDKYNKEEAVQFILEVISSNSELKDLEDNEEDPS